MVGNGTQPPNLHPEPKTLDPGAHRHVPALEWPGTQLRDVRTGSFSTERGCRAQGPSVEVMQHLWTLLTQLRAFRAASAWPLVPARGGLLCQAALGSAVRPRMRPRVLPGACCARRAALRQAAPSQTREQHAWQGQVQPLSHGGSRSWTYGLGIRFEGSNPGPKLGYPNPGPQEQGSAPGSSAPRAGPGGAPERCMCMRSHPAGCRPGRV